MDFRKVVFAFAALVLFAGLASAQIVPITCTASTAVPPTIRGEGYTELVGDIVLICTSGAVATPGAVTTFANVQVFLTQPVTSRLLSGSTNVSEALLMIDEPPTSALQVPCPTPLAGGGSSFCGASTSTTSPAPIIATAGQVYGGNTYTAGALAGANVYQGVVSGQSVTFFGVPVIPPATAGGSRIYRITNIRVPGSGSNAFPTQIQAAVSISGSSSVSISNPNQIVALSQNGLNSTNTVIRNTSNGGTLSTPVGLPQCSSQGNDGSSSGNRQSGANFGFFRFGENFGNAFKTRHATQGLGNVGTTPTNQNVPGQVNNNSESGFIPTFNNFNNGTFIPGLADSGTRLKATFNNIPNGVRVYVSVANMSSTTAATSTTAASYAQLVATTSGGEIVGDYNGLPAVTTAGDLLGTAPAVELPVINGQAVAVWEIVNSLPFQVENFDFGFAVRYASSTATNSPAPGTLTVNMSFAPSGTVLSATNAASNTAPIPRFQDTSTATRLFTIAPCRSVLLFPYVANTGPFDTGLAISNTSTDPFGTTPQAGTCVLNAYGTNAPTQPINTPSVASGSFTTVLASSQLPGFVGYVIATCNFQYAHGFAFISDLGTRNFAMGYLALVIPDPGSAGTGRPSNDFSRNNPNSSEILGQ